MAQIQWHLLVTAVKNESGLYTLMYAHMYRVSVDDGSREDRFAAYTLQARFDQLQVRNATVIEISEDEYVKQFFLWGHEVTCLWIPVGVFTVRWSELLPGAPPGGDLIHTQMHQIGVPPPPPPQPPPQPPPPVVIPPPAGPPTEIVLQPPDQPPRPIELPPEGPPPDHPPRKPPPELQPPISPRETDMETFRRFLERWGHQLDWVSVNVPLDGGEWVEDLEEPYRSLWAKLTQHKADVVFKRKGVIYVAEVKPRLSRGAIGEAFVAHMMYRKLYRPAEETRAAVICMTASPLLLQYACWAGVLVFVTDAIDGTGWFGEVRIRHRMR